VVNFLFAWYPSFLRRFEPLYSVFHHLGSSRDRRSQDRQNAFAKAFGRCRISLSVIPLFRLFLFIILACEVASLFRKYRQAIFFVFGARFWLVLISLLLLPLLLNLYGSAYYIYSSLLFGVK